MLAPTRLSKFIKRSGHFRLKATFSDLEKQLKTLGKTKIKTAELKAVSTAYNFPFKQEATAYIEVENAFQASHVMHWARRYGAEIIPQGGNTSLVESATPLPCGHPVLMLSVKNKGGVVDLQQKCLKAGAGVTVQEAQQLAHQEGLQFSMTYGSKGTATLGGAIGTRAMGMSEGTPQLLRGLTVVDGTGTIHQLAYTPQDTFASNSVLPGRGCTWPLGNQGYLGIVTEASFQLDSLPVQTEMVMMAGSHSEGLLHQLEKMETYLVEKGIPATIDWAELMYKQALENVMAYQKNPFGDILYDRYLLAKIGSTHQDFSLKEVLLDVGLNGPCFIAQSESQKRHLLALREGISDAARQACKTMQLTPVPLDIACKLEALPQVLAHLDHHTRLHRQHVFGHLRQGDKTHAVMHYNLGASLSKGEVPREVETNLLASLYQAFPHISHSGEHGGLGSKTFKTTAQFSAKADLDYFLEQCKRYNTYAVLQKTRLAQLIEAIDQTGRIEKV